MPNLTNHQRSIIMGMFQVGTPFKEIARRLNIHRNTVSNTIRRYHATGSVAELPRSGRPIVTNARDDQYIRTTHLRDRFRCAAFTARNLPNVRNISGQTVRNRLKEWEIKTFRPAQKITLTAAHRTARLAWCTARVHWNHNQWRHVLFTDESSFGTERKRGSMWVYRRRGERYRQFCIRERQAARSEVDVLGWHFLWQQNCTPCRAGESNCGTIYCTDDRPSCDSIREYESWNHIYAW